MCSRYRTRVPALDSDIESETSILSAVLADHPDLRILWDAHTHLPGEIVINGVNSILHILVEAIAERQVVSGDPPEARKAFERMKHAGLSSHAARGMIAGLILWYISQALGQEASFDAESYARQLRLLGTALPKRVGRNDPCPCGSQRKFKTCCEPVFDLLKARKEAGVIVLGNGKYIFGGPGMAMADPGLIEMENRSWIATFLETNGAPEDAIACLRENLAYAERKEANALIVNALQDIQVFCMNHRKYASAGLEVTGRLIALTTGQEDNMLYRCDKADLLAAKGSVHEAEREYQDIFAFCPHYPFARYRYALLLDQYDRAGEAEAILKALLERPRDLDAETRESARGLLDHIRTR
ncbi:MAG: SEC-C domain-containing protein [Bacillota bacterium]|nr:SEC-C domain-containing protein [Bacillota bacterium]